MFAVKDGLSRIGESGLGGVGIRGDWVGVRVKRGVRGEGLGIVKRSEVRGWDWAGGRPDDLTRPKRAGLGLGLRLGLGKGVKA